MSAVIISTSDAYPHGRATNQLVGELMRTAASLERINSAVVTATSGYSGVPGTQFEVGVPSPEDGPVMRNLFGVQASATPGEQGSAYSYAIGRLHELWAPFWEQARPYVEQLDNGQ